MLELSVMDVFEEGELDRAGEIYAETPPDDFVRRCVEEVVNPVLPRIDGRTGDRNDPVAIAEKVRRTFHFIMGRGGFVSRLQ